MPSALPVGTYNEEGKLSSPSIALRSLLAAFGVGGGGGVEGVCVCVCVGGGGSASFSDPGTASGKRSSRERCRCNLSTSPARLSPQHTVTGLFFAPLQPVVVESLLIVYRSERC